ncbi:hypothetical protein PTSG_00927 [Salpingoeca rosetta]|uniref:Obg family GTPase CgtA n=1 Tax=Salpingoeca rosetta (strain ATCC 50818 / BSB-021) TaxID=946362 RepID=F2TXW5_SALR5|nr:uncharacterized protein PTSG_00927 [Salpingoeca rosetta]EGD76224.1 hypothetical protein PTSG_00927 [Salpingoeca rosetta]|eukprot:XP_004998399.1 hypothetical protein PTSG_00927 [Salpingoeca rosetta]
MVGVIATTLCSMCLSRTCSGGRRLLLPTRRSTAAVAAAFTATAVTAATPIAALHQTLRTYTKRANKEKGFVDLRRVFVRGGKGGLGCFSYENLGYKRKRRPDGADGGRGGSVNLTVDETVGSLEHIPATISGITGGQGSSNNKLGANAKPRTIKVPAGTIVYDEDGKVVADLERPGESFCAAVGGKGGRGNSGGLKHTRCVSFDDEAKQGTPGEEKRFVLELKTLADVGLVGMPNAGKSTFLNAVSNAHPRVAPYPFTTLNPHLGVVDFSDYWRMRVADIPGILPGAHENKGLGHNFLRHIERNAVLLYIIDISESLGSPPAVEAFETLREELRLYKAELAERPFLIAANKVDCEGAQSNLERLRKHIGADKAQELIVPMAASTGEGVVDVTTRLRVMVEQLQKQRRHRMQQPGQPASNTTTPQQQQQKQQQQQQQQQQQIMHDEDKEEEDADDAAFHAQLFAPSNKRQK